MAKGSTYPELFNPQPADYVLGIDQTAIATKKIKISALATAVLQTAYPVGALYHSTVAANPGDTLGFGNWSAFAQGQMLVGKAGTGTFANAGATGGEEKHQLSEAELANHAHGVYDPGHSHGSNPGNNSFLLTSPGGTNNRVATSGSGQQVQFGGPAGSGTGIGIYGAGGNQPHNNMPPYVVVYIWRRDS